MKFKINENIKNPVIKKNSLSVDIAFSTYCNLKCYMCYRQYKNMKQEIMKDDFYNKFLEYIPYIKELNLKNLGEPLTTPNIIEKLKTIKKINPEIKIRLTTNGIGFLKSPDFMKEVLLSIDTLILSLNGIGKTYNAIMKPGNWKSIKVVLNKFKKISQKLPENFDSQISFVVMRKNHKDIAGLVKTAKKYNFKKIFYRRMWIHDRKLLEESIIHDKELYNAVIKLIKKAEKKAEKNSILSDFSQITDMSCNNKKPEREIICTAPWDSLAIKANGNVHICCLRRTLIGNLKKNSIPEILNSEEVQLYRSGMFTKNFYKECAFCHKISPSTKYFYEKL
ncbi:MAG: SPASM domain-containing protein [Spirochaetes bacterium]|nr:SPASM domain-containing protein [Spirochaetota bacterium]